MKFCTNCGAQLPEGVKFCTECGTKFDVETPVQETSAEPVYEAPAAPAEPAYEAPAEPAYEAPAEPAYEAPAEPAYETPAEPAYEAPAEPVYTPPVQQTAPQKKKKSLLPVFLGIAAAVIVLIVLLASCGGKDQGTEADWGLYEGVSCVYAGLDIGADDDWVELKQKGKATVFMLGEEISCKWELDGTAFTLKEGGSEYYGTLSGGQLTFDLDGVVYTFEKKGGAPAASGDKNGDKELGKKDGPVTYKLVSFTMEGEEMGPDMVEMMGGGYVVLNGDGTGTFAMFGENFPVTDDGKSIEADGQKMPYTLTDNGMELDMEGSIFVLEVTDEEVPAAPAGQTSGEDKGDPTELSYWEGDYYGWWVIDSIWEGEDFEEGDWWDCCATIELDEDGTGTMILWDEDMPKDDPLAEMGITVTVDGNGVARFCSEEGWFLDDEMEHADWVFYSDATEYGDVLYIDGEYEDGTYDFWYYVYLRPWGTDWSDVAENEPEDMPSYYEDWYLPLIEEGVMEAPATIG